MANERTFLDSDYDWDNERKMKVRKKAYEQGVLVEISHEKNEELLKEWSEYFIILRHKDIEDDTLNMAKCKDFMNKSCKSILKLIRNKTQSGSISFPTSTMSGHTCYKKYLVEQIEQNKNGKSSNVSEIVIPTATITACKDIILKEGTIPCIIEDIRPFSFSEGSGFKKVAKSLIRVGTILKAVPSDEVLEKLIPKRKANTSGVKNEYKIDEKELKEHFVELDQEILPAFHLSFDLWTDKGKKHHYIGVMAHEVNKDTKEIETYCLEMMDWDKLDELEIGM